MSVFNVIKNVPVVMGRPNIIASKEELKLMHRNMVQRQWKLELKRIN